MRREPPRQLAHRHLRLQPTCPPDLLEQLHLRPLRHEPHGPRANTRRGGYLSTRWGQIRDSSGSCGWILPNRAAEPLVVAWIRLDRERRLLVHRWTAPTGQSRPAEGRPKGKPLTARSIGAATMDWEAHQGFLLAGRLWNTRTPPATCEDSASRAPSKRRWTTHTNPRRTPNQTSTTRSSGAKTGEHTQTARPPWRRPGPRGTRASRG